jgi:hypothetical protein
MLRSTTHKKLRPEKTADLVSRHKHVLWSRFALRATVVSVAIACGALVFRNLDLVPDLSYVDANILSGSRDGQYHSIIERLAGAAAGQGGTIENIPSPWTRMPH